MTKKIYQENYGFLIVGAIIFTWAVIKSILLWPGYTWNNAPMPILCPIIIAIYIWAIASFRNWRAKKIVYKKRREEITKAARQLFTMVQLLMFVAGIVFFLTMVNEALS